MSDHFALHAGDSSYPPLSTVPPAHDFSKLGFDYITVLGLANQVVPHTESWQSLATAVNYLIRIAPNVYLAFQAQTASPAGAQPDSGMGHDNRGGRPCLEGHVHNRWNPDQIVDCSS
ncbi:hypothetical protein DSO57_1022663 [Entomophthora muscae]|uniref:Uncharacterized protein n=1 Tax=Entomophthora muscae TaxID=34485 RepID=A0ACC2U0Y7_9FUNG|nr:hypothetical protein DSO57_1022663 [Entomophthora muscae]